MNKLATVAIAMFCFHCGGFEIPETNLSGIVNGQSWSLSSSTAETSSVFFDDEEGFSVDLYGGADKVSCDDFAFESSAPEIIFSMPKTPGEYPLKLDLFSSDNQTVTVVPAPGENIILIEGLLRIDSISDGLIKGGLFATDGGDYEVAGTFEIPICADE